MTIEKVSPQNTADQNGASINERLGLLMKCVWRPIFIFEVGLRGAKIGICVPVMGKTTNSIIKVLAKASTTQAFKAKTFKVFEPTRLLELDSITLYFKV